MNYAIPGVGLPLLHYPKSSVVDWLDTDNWNVFKKHGGHPVFNEKSVTYSMNKQGYRCPEFDATADIRVISIGCSNVLGVGLPKEDVFHERFVDRLRRETGLSVTNFNLGVGGGSNDYIARTLYLGVSFLQPHIVLVGFTYPSRREHVAANNELVMYFPNWDPPSYMWKETYKHIAALTSPFDDEVNLFRAYRGIQCLVEHTTWLYSNSVFDTEFAGLTAGWASRNNYAGFLPWLDTARDHQHAGPKSHKLLADNYWKKFLELVGSLDEFLTRADLAVPRRPIA